MFELLAISPLLICTWISTPNLKILIMKDPTSRSAPVSDTQTQQLSVEVEIYIIQR